MKSSFQIPVSILFPVNGVALKSDRKLFSVIVHGKRVNHIIKYFADGQKIVKDFAGKLNKEYQVLTITEAQFGKIDLEKNNYDWKKSIMEVATTDQINSIVNVN